MIIQTNLAAEQASRQTNINAKNRSRSTERLSSGYRINRAADDAAGLAISEKLRRQIRGLERGSMNIGEGNDMISIADKGMEEMESMMQRVRELAVQSANDTNTAADRKAIQQEVDDLVTEIERTSHTTTYNGISLLDNTYQQKVDPVTGETLVGLAYTLGTDKITMSGNLGEMMDSTTVFDATASNTTGYKTNETTSQYTTEYFYVYTTDAAGNITGIDPSQTTTIVSPAQSVNRPLESYYAPSSVSSTAVTSADALGNTLVETTTTVEHTPITDSYAAASIDFSGLGTDYKLSDLYGQGFNSTCATCGAHYSISFAEGTDVNYSNTDGHPTLSIGIDGVTSGADLVQVMQNALMSPLASDFTDHYTQYAFDGSKVYIYDNRPYIATASYRQDTFSPMAYQPDKEVPSRREFHIQCSSNEGDALELFMPYVTAERMGIDGISVLNGEDSALAISTMDYALSYLNSERSKMGAYANRLEHAQKNVDNTGENTTAAESRIRDANMADEIVENATSEITQQFAQSMIAQANQSVQGVLRLLEL